MNFTVTKTNLLRELALIQSVVAKKTNDLPMLASVRLDLNGCLKLSGTDLDVTLRSECPAEGDTGVAVVSARKLYDVIRACPDGDLRLSLIEKDRWLSVDSAGSSLKLANGEAQHYPAVPQVPTTEGLSVPAAMFRRMIEMVAFVPIKEESRYALAGALLEANDGWLRLIATDGHRLALAETEHDGTVRTIIPEKALDALLKVCTGDGDVIIRADDSKGHLFFETGDRLLSARGLAGQFPAYDLVIPKSNNISVTVSTERLAQGVKRVALTADERSHGIKLKLGAGRMVLSSRAADIGESTETISVDYSGSEVEIGFNANYVLDFLGVVGSDETLIEMSDPDEPALFRPAARGEGEPAYRFVVMPLRLQ